LKKVHAISAPLSIVDRFPEKCGKCRFAKLASSMTSAGSEVRAVARTLRWCGGSHTKSDLIVTHLGIDPEQAID
jgi:hypothetical protein